MGTQKIKRRCVIFGGGHIADDAAVAAMLEPDDFILCADSGYRHCKRLGLSAQLLVGDFDSLQPPLPAGLDRLQAAAEKDETDTALALGEGMRRGYRDFLLLGMLGGRLDHTLANLQLLVQCARSGCRAQISDGATFVRAFCAAGEPVKIRIARREGYYFSLLAYSERCEGVFIAGAKYPLQNFTLQSDTPLAVSNEFLAGDAEIVFSSGTLLVVETPKDTPGE